MYLEEKVARVEAFMELFLLEHPDMCPHQWVVEEGSYVDDAGNRVTTIYCRFCNKQQKSKVAINKDENITIGFSF